MEEEQIESRDTDDYQEWFEFVIVNYFYLVRICFVYTETFWQLYTLWNYFLAETPPPGLGGVAERVL